MLHNQSEIGDSEAGSEILDIILAKGNYDDRFSNKQLASSPPFFCGSPPSWASKPVIQDEHFGNSGNMALQHLCCSLIPCFGFVLYIYMGFVCSFLFFLEIV